ncbi:MAG: hypothetical protein M1827_001234 [Pycnora praestabilis]|nr:MAG: hypothetical protein M1827_001234 [Pycnora praestabilis]
MSSMRNAVQRRNHRERAQPLERSKWGVLEKHKVENPKLKTVDNLLCPWANLLSQDYSLRAKDFNAKKARLKTLRQKAADRNPDEFHFGMMSSKTDRNGQKLGDRGNKALSHEAVSLLKTQDAGYLRLMAQKSRRERERLEEAFVLGEAEGKEAVEVLGGWKGTEREGEGRHTVFVESREEQKAFDPEEWFETDKKSLDRKFNRLRRVIKPSSESDEDSEAGIPNKASTEQRSQRAADTEIKAMKEARVLRKQRKHDQEVRKLQLEASRTRERDLMAAEHELELQRAKMSNSIGGITRAGIKWKVKERKK